MAGDVVGRGVLEVGAALDDGSLPGVGGKVQSGLNNIGIKGGAALAAGIGVGVAAAVGAAVAGLARIGDVFDQNVRNPIVIGTGAAGSALEGLEDSAKGIATTIPVSFGDASDAIATLNTATGESGESLERLSTQVLDASRLLGEDGTQNAEAFGKALNQWGMDADEGADSLDGLFKLTQDYGVGLGEVTGQLNTYGSVLQNAGFSMEESAVLFASLQKSGLDVSRVMPGLNKSFRDWAGEGKNVQDELGKTVDAIGDAETGTEALALATDVFGAEGAQRMTTAIRNGSFALEDLDGALQGADGAIAETGEATRTFGDEWGIFKNKSLDAIEPLGSAVSGALTDALGGFNDFIGEVDFSPILDIASDVFSTIGSIISPFFEAFKPLVPLILDLGRQLGELATTASPLGAVFQAIQPLLPQIASAMAAIAEAIGGALSSALSAILPVLTNLAGTVIAALSQGFEALLPVIETIVPIIGQLAETLGDILAEAITALTPTFELLAEMFMQVSTALTPLIESFLQLVPQIISLIEPLIQLIGTILPPLIELFNQILPPVMAVVDAIIGALIPIVESLIDILSGVITFLTGVFTGNWSQAWEGIKQIFSGIWNLLKSIVTGAWNIITSLIENGLKVVSAVWDATWSAIGSLFSSIWDGIRSVASSVWNWIKSQITSFLNGVKSVWNSTWNAIKSFFSSIWNGIKSAASGFFNSIKSTFNNVMSFIRGIPGKIVSAIGNLGSKLIASGRALIDGFLNGIKGAWDNITSWVSGAMDNLRGLWPFSPAKWGPFSGRGYVTYSGEALGRDFAESTARALDDGSRDIENGLGGIQGEFNALADGQGVGSMTDVGLSVAEQLADGLLMGTDAVTRASMVLASAMLGPLTDAGIIGSAAPSLTGSLGVRRQDISGANGAQSRTAPTIIFEKGAIAIEGSDPYKAAKQVTDRVAELAGL